MGKPRLTYATGLVLRAIARGYRHGFDIMDVSGLPDGTVYPILRRMEEAGWLESRWEDADAAAADGRPPRRYYRLTKAGRAALVSVQERFKGIVLAVPPKPAGGHG